MNGSFILVLTFRGKRGINNRTYSEMGVLCMAITDIYWVLDKELKDVIYDPDERFAKAEKIVESMHVQGKEVARRIISSILFELYEYKIDLLEADLCRLLMFSDGEKVKLEDKFTYLRIIMPVIKKHFNGDYRVLLGEIRRWHSDYDDDSDIDELPFK